MVETNPSDPFASLKDEKITNLFIGNPGVGKSTLLNGLIGRVIFKSGISLGTGLTSTLQVYINDAGDLYFDTPGLSDEEKRKEAAAEIEKALKKGGVYRIFFVVTLESGRIKPDDKATMKLVLEAAAQIKNNSFSIIVNKVSPQICQLMKDVHQFTTMRTKLNANLPSQTDKIFYNANDPGLVDADDKLPSLSAEFSQFVRTAPEIEVAEDQVKPIQWDQFDRMQKDLARMTEALEKNKQLMDEQKIEQEKKFQAIEKEKQENEIRYRELIALNSETERRLKEAEQKMKEAEQKMKEAEQKMKEEEERKAREAIDADRNKLAGQLAALQYQIEEIGKNAQREKLEARKNVLDAAFKKHHEYLAWHKRAILTSPTWKSQDGKRHKHSEGIVGQTKAIANNRVAYNEIVKQLGSL